MDWKLSRALMLPLIVAVAACDGGDKDDKGSDTDSGASDTDTGGGTTCNVSTSLVSPKKPASGDIVDVYYRAPIAISFSQAQQSQLSDGFATLTDDSGATVDLGPANWNSDKQVTFAEHAPLSPNSTYSLSVTSSCKTTDFTFTTNDVGDPINSLDDILNNTYAVDITDPGVTFIEPASLGSVLGGLLGQVGDFTIAIVPYAYDDTTQELTFYGGVVSGGEQDVCQPTLDFSDNPADFSQDPFFLLDASAGIEISYSGISVPIKSLKLGGSFTSSGDAIEGITLDGLIDARDLAPVVGDLLGDESGTPDGLCELVGGFGVSCGPCADSMNYCLHLVATNIPAPKADFDLAEIPDPPTDPSCDTDAPTAN